MFQGIVRKPAAIVSQHEVHPIRLRGERAAESLPFAFREMVVIPGGQHDLRFGIPLTQPACQRLGNGQESIGAPRRATRTGTAALIVGPDDNKPEVHTLKGIEHFLAPPQDQLQTPRLVGTNLDVVMPAGLGEVSVMPRGPIRAQFLRTGRVGFIGE